MEKQNHKKIKTLSQTNLFAIVIILFLSFLSCSNDDDSVSEPTVTTEELLANKWFLRRTEDLTATPPTVLAVNACEQFTNYNFLLTGELFVEIFSLDISSDCISEGIQSFIYSYDADISQVLILEDSLGRIFTLESVSETELIISNASQRITFGR